MTINITNLFTKKAINPKYGFQAFWQLRTRIQAQGHVEK